MEFTQQKWEEKEAVVVRMEKENRLLHAQLTKQTEEIISLKKEVREITERTDYLDDYSRRNNLRICGIPEDRNEN